jgi:hypothetical protein
MGFVENDWTEESIGIRYLSLWKKEIIKKEADLIGDGEDTNQKDDIKEKSGQDEIKTESCPINL